MISSRQLLEEEKEAGTETGSRLQTFIVEAANTFVLVQKVDVFAAARYYEVITYLLR